MKLIKNIRLLVLICMFCAIYFYSNAQKRSTVIGTGTVKLVNITNEEAKDLALRYAKLDANEKLGSYVMSSSTLENLEVNDQLLEIYRSCSQVLACSKLIEKNKEIKWDYNKGTGEPQAVTVIATFEFHNKSFMKEMINYLKNTERDNNNSANDAIAKQKEFEYINEELSNARKVGNVVKVFELSEKRDKILREAGGIFYDGSTENEGLDDIVRKNRTKIYSLVDGRLKKELSQQNQYGSVIIDKVNKKANSVTAHKHKVELIPIMKWNPEYQINTLNLIDSCRKIQFPNMGQYKNLIYRRLNRLDKSNNEFVFEQLSKKRFSNLRLKRHPCYQRVELVLRNQNDKVIKKFLIKTVPINKRFNLRSIKRKKSLADSEEECIVRPNTHRKISSFAVKQTNLEFFRNRIGLQFFANFSSITLRNNENTFQVPIYNTSNEDNNVSIEFNTFINLNMGRPNFRNNAARFRLGLSLSYINYLQNIEPDVDNVDISTNILTSPIFAFEYGKLQQHSYNGFGMSCKIRSYKNVSKPENVNTLNFYDYTDEFSFYIIRKSFLIGLSYHYSIIENNYLDYKYLSTFSVKLGLNIW